MADDTSPETGGTQSRPDNYASFQGYVQTAPKFGETKDGKPWASFLMRVPNTYRNKEGVWVDNKPSFIEVSMFNAGQIALLKTESEAGNMDSNKPVRAEGYLERRTYEKDGAQQASYGIVTRPGQTAITTGKPEKGKGLLNEVELRGAVGNVRVIEGTKNGRSYKMVEFSLARDKDPDWQAKKAGTFTGEDRSTVEWTKALIKAPKQVEKASKMIEDGDLAKGAIIALKGAIVPANYIDKDGKERRDMQVDVKPFDDSLTLIHAPKSKTKEAEKTATQEAPAAPEANDKPKGKGKGKATGAGKAPKGGRSNDDDEIPF